MFLADNAARNIKKRMMVDSDWIISEAHFDPAFNRAYEGLFTVSSRTLHLRGSLEEHLLDAR